MRVNSSDAPSSRAISVRQELMGTDLDADEVAYVLGMDRATVLRYCRDGVLGGVYRLGRRWVIPQSSLLNYREKLLNRVDEEEDEDAESL